MQLAITDHTELVHIVQVLVLHSYTALNNPSPNTGSFDIMEASTCSKVFFMNGITGVNR
jgi:hypothetical protein